MRAVSLFLRLRAGLPLMLPMMRRHATLDYADAISPRFLRAWLPDTLMPPGARRHDYYAAR
jgi:hypothetical protein